jgi:hypothetical protein
LSDGDFHMLSVWFAWIVPFSVLDRNPELA